MFGNGRVDFEGFVRVVLSAEFAFGLGNRNGGGVSGGGGGGIGGGRKVTEVAKTNGRRHVVFGEILVLICIVMCFLDSLITRFL